MCTSVYVCVCISQRTTLVGCCSSGALYLTLEDGVSQWSGACCVSQMAGQKAVETHLPPSPRCQITDVGLYPSFECVKWVLGIELVWWASYRRLSHPQFLLPPSLRPTGMFTWTSEVSLNSQPWSGPLCSGTADWLWPCH